MPTSPSRLALLMPILALHACGGSDRASYSRDIEPLLHLHCLHCHSFAPGGLAEGGFSVEGYETVIAGGNHGLVLDISNPQASKLPKILNGELQFYEQDSDHYVPTNARQRKLIEEWVENGVLND